MRPKYLVAAVLAAALAAPLRPQSVTAASAAWPRAVPRGRRSAGPCARLRLCQSRRGAGPWPRSGHAQPARSADAACRTPEGHRNRTSESEEGAATDLEAEAGEGRADQAGHAK